MIPALILTLVCHFSFLPLPVSLPLFSSLHFQQSVKYKEFLRKRCNVNPARGPFHLRAPSRIFWRVVRGMLPHKTARGAAALNRLKCFEGVPPPFDKVCLLSIKSFRNALYYVLGVWLFTSLGFIYVLTQHDPLVSSPADVANECRRGAWLSLPPSAC